MYALFETEGDNISPSAYTKQHILKRYILSTLSVKLNKIRMRANWLTLFIASVVCLLNQRAYAKHVLHVGGLGSLPALHSPLSITRSQLQA